MPTLTPRWVLQYWGTEVCRKSFHDDIWIASLENKIRNSKDDIIVSDVRFPNEVKAIKNQQGKMIWVQRGRLPKWYDVALDAKSGSNVAINELKIQNIHSSEWAWVGTKFDHTIHNDMNIDDLYSEVKSLVISS